MTKEIFFERLGQWERDSKAYSETLPQLMEGYAIGIRTTDRAETFPLITAENWNGLKEYSLSRIEEADRKTTALRIQQDKINGFLARLYALKEGFADHYPKPSTLANWAEIKNLLEAEFLNAGIAQAEADAFIATYGKQGRLTAFNFLKSKFAEVADLLHYVFERHLALYMYHLSCVAHADYNLATGAVQSPSYNSSERITSLLNNIEDRSNTIYGNVRNGDTAGIIDRAEGFDAWIADKIETEVVPILAYAHQERAVETATFATDGKRALRAGMLLQKALFSKAACRWLSWTAQWHPGTKMVSSLFKAARDTANNAIADAGRTLGIDALLSGIPIYNHTDVTLTGVIQNLNVRHLSPTKVLSSAEIRNSDGQAVKLTLPYIKLDSGGLVNGCYAEISGRFLASNPEASGEPAVSLDRLALQELSKTNWTAWLRFQLRHIFEPVGHNLPISFSLEPGNEGGVNPVKYGRTFSSPGLFSFNTNTF